MKTLTLRTDYGFGGADDSQPNGNVLETLSAERGDDGTWQLVTRTGDGTEAVRDAAGNVDELEQRLYSFENPAVPATSSETQPAADETADLRAQVAALTAANAAQAASTAALNGELTAKMARLDRVLAVLGA